MAALWEYAHTHNPRDFGRLIAADQDWFGSCRYAGVGLGTGSGYSWHDRNVVLWMWADAVDLAVARQTIMNLLDSLVPPTTTTSTTVLPATTVPTITPAVTPVAETTSTTVPAGGSSLAQSVLTPAVAPGSMTATAPVTASAASTRVATAPGSPTKGRTGAKKKVGTTRPTHGRAPVKKSPKPAGVRLRVER